MDHRVTPVQTLTKATLHCSSPSQREHTQCHSPKHKRRALRNREYGEVERRLDVHRWIAAVGWNSKNLGGRHDRIRWRLEKFRVEIWQEIGWQPPIADSHHVIAGR